MLQGKTVLITGATGLLGSNLAKECLNRGARVIALGRSEEKLNGCFAEYCGTGTVVNIINKKYGKNLKVVHEFQPINQLFKREGGVKMDHSKLKQLGWDVSVSLYEGMSKLIEEIKNSVY